MLQNHTFELQSVPYISGDSELKHSQQRTSKALIQRTSKVFYYIAAYFDDLSEWLSHNTYSVNHYAWVPYISVNMVAADGLGPGHLRPPFLLMIVNFQLISYQDAPE